MVSFHQANGSVSSKRMKSEEIASKIQNQNVQNGRNDRFGQPPKLKVRDMELEESRRLDTDITNDAKFYNIKDTGYNPI